MGKGPKLCRSCGVPTPYGRNNGFCSLLCEKATVGYSKNTINKIRQQTVKDIIMGSKQFQPDELDAQINIVTSKPVAIFSDIHCPLHDVEFIMQAINQAQWLGCETLIINGDFIDANSISRHWGNYYRRGYELEHDFASAERLLIAFEKSFKNIYYLAGNHCIQRLIKVFGGEVPAQRLFKMFGEYNNLKITSRSYLDVNNDVRVVHPRQYGRVRTSLPQRLAQRFQKHIVAGHEHHVGQSFSSDGKWQAVSVGCMVDVSLQDYVKNELMDFPEPLQGWAIVHGTKIVSFDRNFPFDLFVNARPNK